MKEKRIIWEKYEHNNSDSYNPTDEDYLSLESNRELDLVKHLSSKIDCTPLGEFSTKDPLNPINMYDEFYYANLVGFNINNPNFIVKFNKDKSYLSLDLIEGIAAWKIINPHKLFIIPAKYYDFNDLKTQIEKALMLDSLSSNEKIRDCKKVSDDLKTENKEHFVLLLPNKEQVSRTIDDENYPDLLNDAKEIFTNDPENCYLLINGIKVTEENVNEEF